MKILLPLFICLFSFSAIAQTERKNLPDQDNGTVFLMRSTGYLGSALAFSFFVDDILVCKLMNGYYSAHLIAPGRHTISVQPKGKKLKENAAKLRVNIEAGKRYYIQVTLEPGFFASKLYCQELTETSAAELFKRLIAEGSCN
jgi:hypothetical protein